MGVLLCVQRTTSSLKLTAFLFRREAWFEGCEWENHGRVMGGRWGPLKGYYQVEEFHYTGILSVYPPLWLSSPWFFKEASQDLHKQSTSQITFSTCQHLQIEFPIPSLRKAYMTLSRHWEDSHSSLVLKQLVAILPGLDILKHETTFKPQNLSTSWYIKMS